jgi:glycosyltransferase involved in cell wall biosynthesis
MQDASVIVCTYNRCQSLRRTLESFCQMRVGTEGRWELIVVDNNSRDATRDVCAQFEKRLPLRYVFESRQGQSYARNRGLLDAKGHLLLFTDDDVSVDERWLESYVDAARRWPEAGFFGGKIVPVWDKAPPEWLARHAETMLTGISMSFSKGEEPRFIDERETPFYGANMVFRRNVFQGGTLFREDLGLKGDGHVRSEETEVMRRLMANSRKGLYVPSAIVYHHNEAARMTEWYVRKWFEGYGISLVRMRAVQFSGHMWFGAPRYLWRQLLRSALYYALSRFSRGSEVWLSYECEMAQTWGSICEYRNQAKAMRLSKGNE